MLFDVILKEPNNNTLMRYPDIIEALEGAQRSNLSILHLLLVFILLSVLGYCMSK